MREFQRERGGGVSVENPRCLVLGAMARVRVRTC
jgi:hypothetical protein